MLLKNVTFTVSYKEFENTRDVVALPGGALPVGVKYRVISCWPPKFPGDKAWVWLFDTSHRVDSAFLASVDGKENFFSVTWIVDYKEFVAGEQVSFLPNASLTPEKIYTVKSFEAPQFPGDFAKVWVSEVDYFLPTNFLSPCK